MNRTANVTIPSTVDPTPRVAVLESLGMHAVLVLVREASIYPTIKPLDYVDFIAKGADGRLRCGSLRITPVGKPLKTDFLDEVPVCHPPANPEGLAEAIAQAVLAIEAEGPHASAFIRRRPFNLNGWTPSSRAGETHESHLSIRYAAVPGLEWLPSRPLSDETLCEAWDSSLAPHVTPEDLAATRLFDADKGIDFAAFDAARERGEPGRLRRTFAGANPLLANLVLRDPVLRGAVDRNERLTAVLDRMAPGPSVNLLKRYSRKAPKAALIKLSGKAVNAGRGDVFQDWAIAAAEALPREWLPTTPEEADAFEVLCWAAVEGFDRKGPGARRGQWWLQAFTGAGGRWVEYAQRIADASGRSDCPQEHMIHERAFGLAHFTSDVLVPVSFLHGAGNVLDLAIPRSPITVRGNRIGGLDGFAFDALRQGMDLPSLATMAMRHERARPGIRAVVARYPSKGKAPDAHLDVFRALMSNTPVLCTMPDGRELVPRTVYTGSTIGSEVHGLVDGVPVAGYGFIHADEPMRAWTVRYVASDRGSVPSWDSIESAVLELWGSTEALLDGLTEGRGLPALGTHPALHGRDMDYNIGNPEAVEAMVEAWRPVLPRRWRKLTTAGLASAFDAEAGSFAGRG